MREYQNTGAKCLKKMVCNGCGKVILLRNGAPAEGVLSVRQVWGYFSGKDGQADSFDLCEACYDRFTGQFQIPPEREETAELL